MNNAYIKHVKSTLKGHSKEWCKSYLTGAVRASERFSDKDVTEELRKLLEKYE